MFLEALKRLVESGAECIIFTPYGYAPGVVTSFDGEVFAFRVKGTDQLLTLFAEDLIMLNEQI